MNLEALPDNSETRPRVAIYAGSFDPPTKGHFDIIKRASALFDHVWVAVGVNSKKQPFLPYGVKLESLQTLCTTRSNCTADNFHGLLADYAREKHACALIRGLRPNGDFDNEFMLAAANKNLAPEIETVWLATGFENSFVSSSLVREVANMTLDDRWKKWVPEEIVDLIEPFIEKSRVIGL